MASYQQSWFQDPGWYQLSDMPDTSTHRKLLLWVRPNSRAFILVWVGTPPRRRRACDCLQAACLIATCMTRAVLLQPAALSKTGALRAAGLWAAAQKAPFHTTAADLGVERWAPAYRSVMNRARKLGPPDPLNTFHPQAKTAAFYHSAWKENLVTHPAGLSAVSVDGEGHSSASRTPAAVIWVLVIGGWWSWVGGCLFCLVEEKPHPRHFWCDGGLKLFFFFVTKGW